MKAVVIDDIALCRAETRPCFICYVQNTCAGETPVMEEFSSGEELSSRSIPGDYDVIFIDQYMDGLSGINMVRKIRSRSELVALVFVTTSREHAIESYGVRTCDYPVRPLNYEDFRQTMELARLDEIRGARFIRLEQNRLLLREILWCSQSNHYVVIHTDEWGVLKSRVPFGKLTEILSPCPQSPTCYRCCIINMDRTEHIDGLGFVLGNGRRVSFSGRDRKRIMAFFNDYLFQREQKEEMLW